MLTRKLLGLVLLSFGLNSAFAQQADLTSDSLHFYTLSLEELMNITIAHPTKTEKSIEKAPAGIRLFTQQDIRENGFQTVQQVLDQIPDLQIQNHRANTQRVLLMMDGIPMKERYDDNFNIDEMIPIETVDRIEIINSSISVSNQTNSFAGVVNIVTKRIGQRISVDAGSFVP